MTATRASTLFLLLLAACGGTEPTPNPPPPPPPPPPTPASISVEAGNQQSAASGTAVVVAPAVVVRDGQGRGLAGVAVQFSVAEGGGTVEGANQTTDASGIARVTRWTLGPSGNQRLSAQVGSLAPAVFQATIQPGTELFDVAIPVTGGTYEITAAGHPYRGLKLTVPSGALTTPGTWQLRVLPNATAPTLPNGYQVAGPILEVTTEQLRLDDVIFLDIPVTVPTGPRCRDRLPRSGARRHRGGAHRGPDRDVDPGGYDPSARRSAPRAHAQQLCGRDEQSAPARDRSIVPG